MVKPQKKIQKTSAWCHQKNKWEHDDAIEMLCKLTDELGMPDVFDGVQHGLAIWRGDKVNKPYCAHEVVLKDESVPHRCPQEHRDFVYTTLKAHVPPDKVNDVSRLSGSVMYDPLTKNLTARCGSMEANVATLNLATNIATGAMSIDDIQKNGTYGKQINSISCDADTDEAECEFS